MCAKKYSLGVRNDGRSKAVELLARVYEHVEHKYRKGFRMFTIGWADGWTLIKAVIEKGVPL